MLAGVVLTALYMTRQMIYVFFGDRREGSSHAHESPSVMTVPLIVLAVCSVLFSVALTPAWPWLHDYLTGEVPRFEPGRLIQPMLFVSLALVALGIGLGWLFYRRAGQGPDPLEQAQPALFRFLEERMWLDELYAATVIALAKLAARISDFMDRYVWDGFVWAFGAVGQLFGIFTKGFDEHGINAGVDEATSGARGTGRLMSAAHSGQIQTYLGAVAVGMLALLLLYAWLA
jgi:NADH-quinone oxidoreductase subunit L